MSKPPILKDWEANNVDVPAGYKLFRKHFEELIKEKDPKYGKI